MRKFVKMFSAALVLPLFILAGKNVPLIRSAGYMHSDIRRVCLAVKSAKSRSVSTVVRGTVQ